MTSHHDVAARLRERANCWPAEKYSSPHKALDIEAADLLENQAKALSEAEAERERVWCAACGTVTRDGVCDCNRYQAGHEMRREPSFVNYADECSKDAREQFARALAAEARLAEAMKALTAIAEHPKSYDDGKRSYAVGWAFWNVQNIARAFTEAAKEKT